MAELALDVFVMQKPVFTPAAIRFIDWLGLLGCFALMLLLLSAQRVLRNANAEKLAKDKHAQNEE